MNQVQPIQMIGTQRSGSNLLRLLLNQYPEIAAPHPPHILQRFYPLLAVYGDLSMPKNLVKLVNDVCLLVEKNPVPWSGVELNRKEIADNCESPTLISIFKAIYDKMARCHDASFWVCKSLANIEYIDQMESLGPQPLYIFLYRDGRDVACSFKKAIVGEKHVYHIAKQWRKNQLACIKLKEKIDANRFFQISYEDILNSPEQEMIRLSNFLDVHFDASVFNFYQSEESKKTSTAGKMWENVAKPILSHNSKKYLKELSHEEILIFETVARDVLEILGYTLEFPELSQTLKIRDEDIARFDDENRRTKAEASGFADPEGAKLRQPQDDLIANIKRRLNTV